VRTSQRRNSQFLYGVSQPWTMSLKLNDIAPNFHIATTAGIDFHKWAGDS
jgi:hypothetical protein